METDLRADIVEYANMLPDGHILKDIAIRTAQELGKENPFQKEQPKNKLSSNAIKVKNGMKTFQSIREASAELNIPYDQMKRDINRGIRKYGLTVL